MRYLHRTHGVSVAWLHEIFKSKKYLDLVYETTDRMCADIYTKAFTDKAKWTAVCQLINVVDPSSFPHLVKSKEPAPQEASASAAAVPWFYHGGFWTGLRLVSLLWKLAFSPLLAGGVSSGRLRHRMLMHPPTKPKFCE